MASHAQASDLAIEDSVSMDNNFTREAEVLGLFNPIALPVNSPETQPKANVEKIALNTTSSIKPTEILDQYGLIQSLKGNQLSVRLINGTTRTYKLAANSSPQTFRRGSLVGFNVKGNDQITKLAPPRVRQVFEGTVIVVEKNKLGLVSPTGEQLVTSVSQDTIDHMKIEPGRTLRVIQYEGIWATRVCSPAAEDEVATLSQSIPIPSSETVNNIESNSP